jgi:hypothetical protein
MISYTQRNELGPYGIFFNIMLSETEGFRFQVSGRGSAKYLPARRFTGRRRETC